MDVSMMGTIVAMEMLRKEQERRRREQKEVKRLFKGMDRHFDRQAKRFKVDEAFYDIGFSKVPYRSGRVPNGGVVYEPKKGNALVFASYHDAEAWLRKAGVWK